MNIFEIPVISCLRESSYRHLTKDHVESVEHGRPDRTENPDRSGFWYVVRIFGPRFVGPVRGPDFRSGFFPVRYVVRNLVRTVTWSGTWYGFWSGKSVPGRIFFSVRSVVRSKISKNWKNKGFILKFKEIKNHRTDKNPDRTGPKLKYWSDPVRISEKYPGLKSKVGTVRIS